MFTDGNALAYLALVLWPGVVVVMFRTLSLERALIWSILGGYMVLPQVTAINLPGIPAFDKVTIPNLTAFAACVAIWGRMPSLMPASWIGRGLMVAFLISPSFTVLTNLHPVQFGLDDLGGLRIIDFEGISEDGVPGLPGLRMYDSLSALAGQVLLMLPFFLAREVLRTEAAIRELMVALVIGGAAYALPMLFEVRFSPQLHTIIYGFFQHDFIQAIRAGGYRPFVFMPHGLWVAVFAFMVLMSAAALWRAERKPLWGWAMSMGVVLVVICKSMGVIIFALIFVPLALMLRPRAHLAVAVLLSAVVLTYPALRGLARSPPMIWLHASPRSHRTGHNRWNTASTTRTGSWRIPNRAPGWAGAVGGGSFRMIRKRAAPRSWWTGCGSSPSGTSAGWGMRRCSGYWHCRCGRCGGRRATLRRRLLPR